MDRYFSDKIRYSNILISDLLTKLDPQNQYYNDFYYLSHGTFTTSSEYYGELMLLLEKIKQKNGFTVYKEELLELLLELKKMHNVSGKSYVNGAWLKTDSGLLHPSD